MDISGRLSHCALDAHVILVHIYNEPNHLANIYTQQWLLLTVEWTESATIRNGLTSIINIYVGILDLAFILLNVE